MDSKPIIVAHRGLHHRHPENSLAALAAALTAGFWVECDVQFSADGVPVIMHDDALDRTAEGSGRVDALSAAELVRTRLRGSDQTIPTLQSALEIEAGDGGWLVEIKPVVPRELVDRLVELLAPSTRRWIVQSFHADNIQAVKRRVPTAWLIDKPEEFDHASAVAPAAHVQHNLLSAAICEGLRKQAVRIGAWTVNDPADIARVLRLGVDMIITDEPQRVREATEALKSGT